MNPTTDQQPQQNVPSQASVPNRQVFPEPRILEEHYVQPKKINWILILIIIGVAFIGFNYISKKTSPSVANKNYGEDFLRANANLTLFEKEVLDVYEPQIKAATKSPSEMGPIIDAYSAKSQTFLEATQGVLGKLTRNELDEYNKHIDRINVRMKNIEKYILSTPGFGSAR